MWALLRNLANEHVGVLWFDGTSFWMIAGYDTKENGPYKTPWKVHVFLPGDILEFI